MRSGDWLLTLARRGMAASFGLVTLTAGAANLNTSYVVVSDRSANAVTRFTLDGQFVDRFGQDVSTVTDAVGVFGPDQNLYVGDAVGGKIAQFNGATGQLLRTITAPGVLHNPARLTFGPDSNLYVVDFTGHSVVRFDPVTGQLIDTFVQPHDGGLTNPSGIAFGPDGNLYVTSGTPPQNNPNANLSPQVLEFDGKSGKFKRIFVSTRSGGLTSPFAITFGPDGNLYVTDVFTGSVLEYSGSDGTFIRPFVTAGSGGLSYATGLTFGPDGNLYVCSSTGSNIGILKYDGSSGAYLGNLIPASAGVQGPTGVLFYNFESQIAPTGGNVSAATDQSGNRYVVWDDGGTVYGQLFGANGVQKTNKTRLSSVNAPVFDSKPRVAALSGGGFMAVWQTGTSGVIGIITMPIDPGGTPKTPITIVPPAPGGSGGFDPTIGAPAGPGAIVVFTRNDPGGATSSIVGRKIGADGSPTGGEVTISSGPSATNDIPAAACDTNNAALVAWRSQGRLLKRKFDTNLVPAESPTLVDDGSAGTIGAISVAGGGAGKFILAWSREASLPAKPIGPDGNPPIGIIILPMPGGTPSGTPTPVNIDPKRPVKHPGVSIGSDGNATVVWESQAPNGGSGVYGRTVSFSGLAEKTEFVVSDALNPDDRFTSPAVTLDSNGVPTVASQKSNGAGSQGVFTRTRNGQGSTTGSSTCVASATVACLYNGRFTATVEYRNIFANPAYDAPANVKQTTSFTSPGYETAFFYFNDPNNVEVTVKLLSQGDGKVQVYFGATTDLEIWLTISDATTGISKQYHKDPGSLCGAVDRQTFPASLEASPLFWATPRPFTTRTAPLVATCVASSTVACLYNGRFTTSVRYRNMFASPPYDAPANVKQAANFASPGYETAFFYFNDPNNIEITAKLLSQGDGKVQIYYGATTDLELWFTVADAKSGITHEYHKLPFSLCGEVDRTTFPAEVSPKPR